MTHFLFAELSGHYQGSSAASTGALAQPNHRMAIPPSRGSPRIHPGATRRGITNATIDLTAKPASRITIPTHHVANPADKKTQQSH